MFTRLELNAETRYRLLLQIAQRLRDTLDLDAILNHLLDSVGSVVAHDASGIFILSRDVMAGSARRRPQVIAAIVNRGFDTQPAEDDAMLMRGEGIIGFVIRTGQGVIAPDVRLDRRYVVGRASTRSEIAVPIIGAGRTIGALNLESDALEAFDERDLEILRFFADAAALSIERAMLHRQLMEKRRIEYQLHMAHDVQSRLLPGGPPHVPGYDLAGRCLPSFDVGGDYYDYILLPDGRLGLAIADVSGKGIPAALIMAEFRALLRSHAARGWHPARIAETLNGALRESLRSGDFVTCVYGALEPATGRFEYANCGHNPPLLFRSDGSTEQLEKGGPVIGPLEAPRYEWGAVTLAPADSLLLYTDGVVESMDAEGRLFGVERLAGTVSECRGVPSEELIGRIIGAVRAHSEADPSEDDMTLLALRRSEF